MSIQRKLVRAESPQGQPGFLGPDHVARPVVSGNFSQSDPFIFLMDDVLDKQDNSPVGGPHPHAGFETVSLLLEGEMGADAHKMKGGDFQIMTAGSGVVHTETIDKAAKMRLLQLWINLPKKNRWTTPRVQDLALEHVPTFSRDGVEVKLYSGSFEGLQSPIQNYVPMIVADISLQAGVQHVFKLPADYNSFLYILHGTIQVGEDAKQLQENQVGWLDLFTEEGETDLVISAGDKAARFVLYAGRPLREQIVSQGPFIADSSEDIKRLYQDYRQGKMKHISMAPLEQQIKL